MKSISRKWKDEPKIKKFKREALKNRINPSLEDITIDVKMIREKQKFGGRINILKINYENATSILEAYDHLIGYEVLAKGSARKNPFNGPVYVVPDFPEDSIFQKNNWRINKTNRVEDKVLFLLGIKGDPQRKPGENFQNVWSNPDIPESPIKYLNQKIILEPSLSLGFLSETLDEKLLNEKIGKAKEWMKPYLTLEQRKEYSSCTDSVYEIINNLHVVEKDPKNIVVLNIEVPLGDCHGQKMSAFYNLDMEN